MKKILTMLCLLLTMGAQAQTGTAKKIVDNIREQYAEAKQMIAYNNQSEETRNQITVNISHMVPGTGHQERVVTYYFFTDFDEDAGDYISTPYFITVTYNVAARKYYEEYLLKRTGEVIFAYQSGDSIDPAVGREEARYYWDGNSLVHQQVKGAFVTPEAEAHDRGNNLKEAFSLLMF